MSAFVGTADRPGSPLWELSVDDLLLQEMEVMVFFEGIDAMTSNSVQVRPGVSGNKCNGLLLFMYHAQKPSNP